MAENRIRVRDFTSLTEPSDSVVLVHFEEIGGIIHVYRDGTVVLSSPFGTTVTNLKHSGDQLWRKEVFLSMLDRMGASDQELIEAGQMVEAREEALSRLGFRAAVKQVATESVAHFRDWCSHHGLDYQAMSEEEIDDWLAARLAEVRSTP
jgi:hypothetical protein